jgi:inner membrane protein
MDSVTHIVLGACIGEVLAGNQLGKKALFIGAFAQSIPDLDFIASFFLPVTSDLLAHRGFTHSFLFLILITPLLAWISGKAFRDVQLTFRRWCIFWGLQIFVHIFLDAFNAYGTGWFEPFSHYRVSFNTMFVADPLFTIWPLIAFIALLVMPTGSRMRRFWAGSALTLSVCYWMLGIAFKLNVEDHIEQSFAAKHITSGRHFSTPTPLNNVLWYIVAESDSGFYIGYRSILDKKPTIDFRYVCRNASLLNTVTDKDELALLKRFSQGYYTCNKFQDTVIFNDLRFGEILGWADTAPRCVFYYNLGYPEGNKMIVQRGRFANWDANALIAFFRRIKGI